MTFRFLAMLAVLATGGLPLAAEVVVTDGYFRSSRPGAPSGAAFIVIRNTGPQADRLLGVRSDVAQRVELHTHVDQGDGVLKMIRIENGVEIGPGETYVMQRGGDHVMFMGLRTSFAQGDTVNVTLTFENAGDLAVSLPVDLTR